MKSNKQVMVWFFGIAGILGILSWLISGVAKDWVGGVSLLAFAAGLVVLLIGTVAGRKERLAAHKMSDSK